MTAKQSDRLVFWLFLTPVLVAFTLTVIIPFFMGIFFSLTNWNAISSDYQIVGLKNFLAIGQDTQFHQAFWHSVLYTILNVFLVNLFGFLMALLVTQKLRISNLLRGIFFLPNLIGGLILGFIWQYVFVKAFPAIAGLTGLAGLGVDWLGNADYALFSLVIVSTWQMAGYAMVIYIAGLQNIPDDILEAASIDGAGGLARLWHILLPMLVPAFTITLFFTLTYSFKMYDTNVSLTNGGPFHSSELLAMNIYNEAFGYNNFGLGQAKAVLFFVIIVLVSGFQVSYTKKREVEL